MRPAFQWLVVAHELGRGTSGSFPIMNQVKSMQSLWHPTLKQSLKICIDLHWTLTMNLLQIMTDPGGNTSLHRSECEQPLLVYTRQQIWRVTLPAVTLLNLYSSLRNPLFESAPGLSTGRGDDCWHPGGVKANPWWSLGKDPRAAPRRTRRVKGMERPYLPSTTIFSAAVFRI